MIHTKIDKFTVAVFNTTLEKNIIWVLPFHCTAAWSKYQH